MKCQDSFFFGFGLNCCVVTSGSLHKSHVSTLCVSVIQFCQEKSMDASTCLLSFKKQVLLLVTLECYVRIKLFLE